MSKVIILLLALTHTIFTALLATDYNQISKAISSFMFPNNNPIDSPSSSLGYTPPYNSSAPPVAKKPTKVKQLFNDVTLTHRIPSTFMVGQIFQIQGEVNENRLKQYLRTQPYSTKFYTVTVSLVDIFTFEQISFTQHLKVSERKFIQQCFFQKPGKYYIGIYIGNSGTTIPKIYQVLESSEIQKFSNNSYSPPPAPKNMTFYVQENDFFITWQPIASLTRIIISQNGVGIQKAFIISNDIGKFKVPYSEFENFTKAETSIEIMHAESQDLSAYERYTNFSESFMRKINVTEHHFREFKQTQIEVEELPSQVRPYSNIVINGRVIEQIEEMAFVVNSRNQIGEAKIEASYKKNNVISPSQNFSLSHNIQSEGVYIIQINHDQGFAVVNTPVYVGNSYPLLPDFIDLTPQQRKARWGGKLDFKNIGEQRQFLLKLINQKRAEYGAGPVQIDLQLNRIAQLHARDMIVRNFVSHVNLQGQGPNQRARKQGITTNIGENIAVNPGLDYARYRLDRSPAHLKNTIKKQWTRVGLGVMEKSGSYYVVQKYSSPNMEGMVLSEEEKRRIQLESVKEMNLIAPESVKIVQNVQMSKDLNQWYAQNDISDPSGLSAILRRYRAKETSVYQVSVAYVFNVAEVIRKNSSYFDYRGKNQVAIGVKLVGNELFMIIVNY